MYSLCNMTPRVSFTLSIKSSLCYIAFLAMDEYNDESLAMYRMYLLCSVTTRMCHFFYFKYILNALPNNQEFL